MAEKEGEDQHGAVLENVTARSGSWREQTTSRRTRQYGAARRGGIGVALARQTPAEEDGHRIGCERPRIWSKTLWRPCSIRLAYAAVVASSHNGAAVHRMTRNIVGA